MGSVCGKPGGQAAYAPRPRRETLNEPFSEPAPPPGTASPPPAAQASTIFTVFDLFPEVEAPELVEDAEPLDLLSSPPERRCGELALVFASATSRGQRATQEDRVACAQFSDGTTTCAFFGVFDGHGGAEAAEIAASTMHRKLLASPGFPTDMRVAMGDAFRTTDDAVIEQVSDGSGSTAAVLAVLPDGAWLGGLGDSRVVLSRCGAPSEPLGAWRAHKPDAPGELERIERAGASVSAGRIYGVLAVSRALGDVEFKPSRTEMASKFNGDLVICEPELQHVAIDAHTEFAVLASDGLFERLSPPEICALVKRQLRLTGDAQLAVQHLVDEAAGRSATDNVTAVLVCFHQPWALRSDSFGPEGIAAQARRSSASMLVALPERLSPPASAVGQPQPPHAQ